MGRFFDGLMDVGGRARSAQKRVSLDTLLLTRMNTARWGLALVIGAACAGKSSPPDAPTSDATAATESLYRGEARERLAKGFTAESGTWVRMEGGVEPPKLRRRVTPEYTDDALNRKVEGIVLLEVAILKTGRVGAVRVLRSLDAGLDAKAIAAVREWTFRPGRFQGAVVDVLVELEVEFRLL